MNSTYPVGILTDSNSGLVCEESSRYAIEIIPMPFLIDGTEYFENETITREEFFQHLRSGAHVSTSQPSLDALSAKWKDMLRFYKEIVYIPMSGGLSGSVNSAKIFAREFNNKVFVVDNHRISCTQKQSVLEAACLAQKGKTGREIKDILEKHALEPTIYIAVDTLEYLKKGGRVTAAGAALATVLGLKPILKISGEKLDAYGKARSMKLAQKEMLDAVKKDMATRFAGQKVLIRGAYTCSEADARIWQDKIAECFPEQHVSLDPLALSISCHIGEGSTAIVCMPEIPEINGQVFD